VPGTTGFAEYAGRMLSGVEDGRVGAPFLAEDGADQRDPVGPRGTQP
jgi:hypothetical protein